MLTGHVDAIERDFVAGWATDDQHAASPVSVVVFVNGQRYAQRRCDLNTPDPATSPGAAGHGFRFDFNPPLPGRLDLRIAVRFAATGAIVPGGERVLPGDTGEVPLKPILITAPGRSGTTMFMERLSRCNEVVIAKSHPYEVRMLTYYASAYHVLAAAANTERSTHPDRLEGDGYFIGSNPFSEKAFNGAFKTASLPQEFFAGYMPDQLMSTFKQIILEYYRRHCAEQGKHGATMFAEKNNNLDTRPRKFTQAMFGGKKEIVLVRDPRDLYCSRRSYFGQETKTAIDQILWGCGQLRMLCEEAASDMIFVRYEDIVLGNPTELRRVSDFLGFELHAADTSLDAGSKFNDHATSRSPESSIARWRLLLTADEAQTFGQSCEGFLKLFGYAQDSGEMVPAASVSALQPRATAVEVARPVEITTGVRPTPPAITHAEIGLFGTGRAAAAPLRAASDTMAAGTIKDAPRTDAPGRPEHTAEGFRFIRQTLE
jgi:hypothetical protein